jgi:hypothetical protein
MGSYSFNSARRQVSRAELRVIHAALQLDLNIDASGEIQLH